MVVDINTIKQWFEKDDYPTQEQFYNWLESFIHKNEQLTIQQIQGLENLLNNVATTQYIINLLKPDEIIGNNEVQYDIAAGKLLLNLVIKTEVDCVIKIGSASGLEDIHPPIDVPANKSFVINLNIFADILTPIFISGFPANSILKFYKQ